MEPTISICAIVKNEEKNIKGMIDNVKDVADEIIIVDTGSSDRTVNIIKQLINEEHNKIKLYHYQYQGSFHYGRARDFSIKKATKDYIIILDLDERLSNEFKAGIAGFLEKEKPIVASVKRVDDLLHHLVDYSERIIKNHQNIFYDTSESGRVHEGLVHSCEVKDFACSIWHCQRGNHYVQRPQRIFFQLELQIERVPKTKSFIGHCIRGLWYFQYRFKKLFFRRRLYKDGLAGFKYSFIRALDAFLIEFFVGLKPKKDYKYWEEAKYKNYNKK